MSLLCVLFAASMAYLKGMSEGQSEEQVQEQCLGEFQAQFKCFFMVQESERQCQGNPKVSVMNSFRGSALDRGTRWDSVRGTCKGSLRDCVIGNIRDILWCKF